MPPAPKPPAGDNSDPPCIRRGTPRELQKPIREPGPIFLVLQHSHSFNTPPYESPGGDCLDGGSLDVHVHLLPHKQRQRIIVHTVYDLEHPRVHTLRAVTSK